MSVSFSPISGSAIYSPEENLQSPEWIKNNEDVLNQSSKMEAEEISSKRPLVRVTSTGELQLRSPLFAKDTHFLFPYQDEVATNLMKVKEDLNRVLEALPPSMDKVLHSEEKAALQQLLEEMLKSAREVFLNWHVPSGELWKTKARLGLREAKIRFKECGLDFQHSLADKKNQKKLRDLHIKVKKNAESATVEELKIELKKAEVLEKYAECLLEVSRAMRKIAVSTQKGESRQHHYAFIEQDLSSPAKHLLKSIQEQINKTFKKIKEEPKILNKVKRTGKDVEEQDIIGSIYAKLPLFLEGILEGDLKREILNTYSALGKHEYKRLFKVEDLNFQDERKEYLIQAKDCIQNFAHSLPTFPDQVLEARQEEAMQKAFDTMLEAVHKVCLGLGVQMGEKEDLIVGLILRATKKIVDDQFCLEFTRDFFQGENLKKLANLGIFPKDFENSKQIEEEKVKDLQEEKIRELQNRLAILRLYRKKMYCLAGFLCEKSSLVSKRSQEFQNRFSPSETHYYTENMEALISPAVHSILHKIKVTIDHQLEKMRDKTSLLPILHFQGQEEERIRHSIYANLFAWLEIGFAERKLKKEIIETKKQMMMELELKNFNAIASEPPSYKKFIYKNITEQISQVVRHLNLNMSEFPEELKRSVLGGFLSIFIENEKKPLFEPFKKNIYESLAEQNIRMGKYVDNWLMAYSKQFYGEPELMKNFKEIGCQVLSADFPAPLEGLHKHEQIYAFSLKLRQNPDEESWQYLNKMIDKLKQVHPQMNGLPGGLSDKELTLQLLDYTSFAYMICSQGITCQAGAIPVRLACHETKNPLFKRLQNLTDRQTKSVEIRFYPQERRFSVKTLVSTGVSDQDEELSDLCHLTQSLHLDVSYPPKDRRVAEQVGVAVQFYVSKMNNYMTKEADIRFSDVMTMFSSLLKGMGYPPLQQALV